MGSYEFTVRVDTDIEIPEGDDRSEEDFAKAMLYASSLRRAQDSDGWCDLAGWAWIVDVY